MATSGAAPEAASGAPGEPVVDSASDDPARRRPVWPLTALVVLLGWSLIGWTVFASLVNTARFFGDTPSRDRYVESGMVALTTLLPLVVLLVLGVLAGARWGLGLLALPALVLVPLGLSLLAEPGDPSDPGHARAVRWDDPFADLTRLNWLAAGVLLMVLALVLWRRRRQAVTRSNP